MTLNDQLKAMLEALPNITTADAVAALPDANPNTVRSALARLRNAGKNEPERTPEHDALIRIVGMYADGLVSAEHMFEMMKMVVSK